MYLLGCIDNSNTCMNDVWSSSDGKTWTQITDNATCPKLYGHAAVVLNKKCGLWAVKMEPHPTMFGIQATTMLPAGHKPVLQELCGRHVAVTRLQCLTVNYGLLAEMEAAEHLTYVTQVVAVPVQKSWLKTMKLQEAE